MILGASYSSFSITNLRDLSKTHEERSNLRIIATKGIIKNCRKRRESYKMKT